MMKKRPEITPEELDEFFAADLAVTPELRPEVLERIVNTGLANQTVSVETSQPPSVNWADRFADLFGGWRAASALTACAVAGIYVGYAFPVEDLLSDYSTAGVSVDDTYDLSGLLDPEFSFLEG